MSYYRSDQIRRKTDELVTEPLNSIAEIILDLEDEIERRDDEITALNKQIVELEEELARAAS